MSSSHTTGSASPSSGDPSSGKKRGGFNGFADGVSRLLEVVQQLSLARSNDAITKIVRRAARDLTGADGATFILREGDSCYYIDEDAIAPLWKGRRFPMDSCVSGWAMMNRQAAVIEDIYKDDRVPHDAYRPTFVQSMVMVPIRTVDPIGAIGVYWAGQRKPDEQEVKLLCALADTVAVSLEYVRIYDDLEERVRLRTAELEAANRELETFNYAVSHDLRAPVRAIDTFVEMLEEENGSRLDETGHTYVQRIRGATERMGRIIDDMLKLARANRARLERKLVDLSAIAQDIVAELKQAEPERPVEISIQSGLAGVGDPSLLRLMLENLISNAWKFTSQTEQTRIDIGAATTDDGEPAFFVRDNGAGFDAKAADQLFQPFRRFHDDVEFKGTGVGLATARRILERHQERIWAESYPGEGATFYFTLRRP